MTETNLPANIQEFSQVTAVIFAQLYESFPIRQDINADAVAATLGHSLTDVMPSGRKLSEVLAYTVSWLVTEGFINSAGAHPRERVTLTAKALATMNAVPPNLGQPLGPQIADAAKDASSDSGKNKLAELVGSLLGSFTGSITKSLGS